jgi:hypothetical protein
VPVLKSGDRCLMPRVPAVDERSCSSRASPEVSPARGVPAGPTAADLLDRRRGVVHRDPRTTVLGRRCRVDDELRQIRRVMPASSIPARRSAGSCQRAGRIIDQVFSCPAWRSQTFESAW